MTWKPPVPPRRYFVARRHHDRFAKAAVRKAIRNCVADVGQIQVGGVATAGTLRAKFCTLGKYDVAALTAEFDAEYARLVTTFRTTRKRLRIS